MRAPLRLGLGDAVRHPLRSLLSVLFIALAVAALIGFHGMRASETPRREVALAGLHPGLQAEITATGVPRMMAPFPQVPEGAPGPWLVEPDQIPASASELAEALDPGTRLIPYYVASGLIVAGDVGLPPGTDRPADLDDYAAHRANMVLAEYREGSGDALDLLLPVGSVTPTAPDEAVVTSALAARLGLEVGGVVTVVAPPFNGWMGAGGRVAEVIENRLRAMRVVGIVDSSGERVFGLDGWISKMVEADHAGVDGHYLAVGAPVTWEQAKRLNMMMAFAVSREVLTNYPAASELYPTPVAFEQVAVAVASLLVSTGLGSALALLLITPAFLVAAEQQRRTLGLLSAVGAAPRQLAAVFVVQGLMLGLCGGVLGSAVGVAGSFALRDWVQGRPINPSYFPWWTVPVALIASALIGVVATLIGARRVARLEPVVAIKESLTTSTPGRHRSSRALVAAGLGLLALAAGAGALAWPHGGDEFLRPGEVPPQLAIPAGLIAVAFLAALAAGLFAVAWTPTLSARLAPRATPALRLALRDAADHPSRFVPAAAAVLVTVLLGAYQVAMIGSIQAHLGNGSRSVTSGFGVMVSLSTPVTDAFDSLVLEDAVRTISEQTPFDGSSPVWGVNLTAEAPEAARCPDEQALDPRSVNWPGYPPTCVHWSRGAQESSGTQTWLNYFAFAMGPEAMRASGFPQAQVAAEVLERGGVIVGNAALIDDDGKVLVVSPTGQARLPAMFVHGAELTVTPETAELIGGAQARIIGAMLIPERDIAAWEAEQTATLITEGPLTWSTGGHEPYPWGSNRALVGLLACLALAALATLISLTLARTQTKRDLITIAGVGAAPGFARRFALAQGLVIVAVGAPLGAVLGVALAALQVLWNDKVDGGWIDIVPIWPLQGVFLGAVGLVAVVAALAAGTGRVPLVRRRLD